MTAPTEDPATKAAREMDAEWCADTSTRLKEYARERQQFFARYLHKFAEAGRAPSGFAVEAERVVRKLATFPVARAPERALTEPERLVLVARDLVAMLPPHTIGYQPAAGPVQGHPGHGASVDGVPVGNVEAQVAARLDALSTDFLARRDRSDRPHARIAWEMAAAQCRTSANEARAAIAAMPAATLRTPKPLTFRDPAWALYQERLGNKTRQEEAVIERAFKAGWSECAKGGEGALAGVPAGEREAVKRRLSNGPVLTGDHELWRSFLARLRAASGEG